MWVGEEMRREDIKLTFLYLQTWASGIKLQGISLSDQLVALSMARLQRVYLRLQFCAI
jgi:hypothetical protein